MYVGYRGWGMNAAAARAGLYGLMSLATGVSVFTSLLVVAGVSAWWDLRREECQLVQANFAPDFREAPNLRNFYRWYETYALLFMVLATVGVWVLLVVVLLPNVV